MNIFIKVCKILDENNLFHLSDKLFIKLAESQKDILKKRILIPTKVAKEAEEAYKKRFDEVKYGDKDMFEIARKLHQNSYMEISDILDIHKYTIKHRFTRSRSKKHPSYWEYQLYGGTEGKDWSSDIIRIYLPNKWKIN